MEHFLPNNRSAINKLAFFATNCLTCAAKHVTILSSYKKSTGQGKYVLCYNKVNMKRYNRYY